ncbi:MAG: nickel-responsive transcriptional regulator NikR [Candidatus Bathyarchaeota archaeon]
MGIISLSFPDELLVELDSIMVGQGYTTRSEVVREAVRDYIAEKKWLGKISGEIMATVTIIFEKDISKDTLSTMEHEYDDIVNTLLHVHLDEKSCLEVLAVRGDADKIRKLMHRLLKLRGMKQVKLAAVTS